MRKLRGDQTDSDTGRERNFCPFVCVCQREKGRIFLQQFMTDSNCVLASELKLVDQFLSDCMLFQLLVDRTGFVYSYEDLPLLS